MANKTEKGLNDRELLFVQEYLIDLNQTQAAIRSGYSHKTAKQIACALMKKTKIREAVEKAMATRSRRTGISVDRVLLEIGRCCFYNALDFINVNDATVNVDNKEDDGAVIAGIKVKTTPTEDGIVVEREVKLVPKDKMLELAGRHLGMWDDKLKVSVVPPKIVDDVDD